MQSNIDPMTYVAPSSPLNVKVGLLEEYERITFVMHGRYRIETLSGEILRPPGSSDLRWRALVGVDNSKSIWYFKCRYEYIVSTKI